MAWERNVKRLVLPTRKISVIKLTRFLTPLLCFLLLASSGWAQKPTEGKKPEDTKSTDDKLSYPGAAKLEKDLKELLEKRRIAGLAATIVKDQKILWSGAYGWADVASKKPITSDTLFQLASVSKTITVCAILQQVERGLIDLDTDINKVLPFKVRHPEHPEIIITLRSLLTHTAAIRDNWNLLEETWVKDGDFPVALGESLKRYLVPDGKWYKARRNFQRWAPGKRNEYSNVGIALAAYVAEVAAKKPFEELCQQGIFKPLDMEPCSYRLKPLDRSKIAIPHQWKNGKHEPLGHHGYLDFPAGTLRASTHQMARFLMCIMSGGEYQGKRILKEKSVREMLKVQYPELEETQALVWFRETDDEAGTMIGHDGSDPGVLTMMFYQPEKRIGFILLMNGEPRGRGVDEEIFEILGAAFSQ